jgi:multiple antibiotic resistance protein
VITISSAHSGHVFPTTTVIAICAVLAVTWLVLVFATRFAGGGGLVKDMITRYMGLIVIAMGIQFAFDGCKSFVYGT